MKKTCCLFIVVLITITGCRSEISRSHNDFLPGAEPEYENEWKSSVNIPDEIQQIIIRKISELPEYKEVQKNIDSVSHHKRGVTAIIAKSENEQGYSVQIGYNRAERFETYYFFKVAPVTYDIKILDLTEDEYVTPEEWRKRAAGK